MFEPSREQTFDERRVEASMAAVAYPYVGARPVPSRAGRAGGGRGHLQLVEGPPPRARRRLRLRPLRVLAIVVAAWFGIGALAAPARTPALAPAASVHQGSPGVRYTVRPGDTLWAIARRLEPTGDPRPLVDELSAELGGRPLEPGMTLVLP